MVHPTIEDVDPVSVISRRPSTGCQNIAELVEAHVQCSPVYRIQRREGAKAQFRPDMLPGGQEVARLDGAHGPPGRTPTSPPASSVANSNVGILEQ